MIIHVIDVETTGLDPATDKVVEVAAVRLYETWHPQPSSAPELSVDWEIFELGSTFVNPHCRIPPEASAVHHITDDDVANAPDLDDAVDQILLRREVVTIIAGHAARFDHGFLPMLHDRKWIDTYRCALHIWPDAPNHKNQTLLYWLGIDLPRDGAHRALADATVTAHVLRRMIAERPVDELIRLSTKAVVLKKVGFGKHFGALWVDVPMDYLRWAERQDFEPDVKFTIKSEIARRNLNG